MLNPTNTSCRHRGFTLVELLVVISIIAVLTAMVTVVVGRVRSGANQVKCMSNQRQIGMALLMYCDDNGGQFPQTTHSTGPFRKDESWVFKLSPYLGSEETNIDEVRICPADPKSRQDKIRTMNATSYVLNDLVFDSFRYNRSQNLASPSETFLLFILSEDRTPSVTNDHIHGGEWSSWSAVLNDIEPDRHRAGGRSDNRTKGSANYLFADGHVENIKAADFKQRVSTGTNPAIPPLQ